jgi:two-component sensor histidine kinase
MEVSADALAMLDALPEPSFLILADGVIGAANRRARTFLSLDFTGRTFADLHAGDKRSFEAYLDRCRGSKSILIGSLSLRTSETVSHLQCYGNRIVLTSGAALLVRLTQADERFKQLTAKIGDLNSEVKQRRHAEAVLSEALKERDLLLRELQHRVKNNMHMLAALLSGMERESSSAEARLALRDASNRFGAVSAVQQLLYGSSMEHVQSEALIATVAKSTLSLAFEKIELDLNVEDFSVPVGIATSVALIMNEVLTNAVKYGRPSDRVPRIHVECARRDGKMHLMVADNGPGFNLPEATKRASGIGLVRGLLRQLGGSFIVDQDQGTRCRIEIPLVKAN